MPDGNGLELLKTIKKHQIKSGVIIISAKNSTDDKINGLDLGADDYLTKPFQFSRSLNSRIRAVLRRRKFDGSSIVTFNEISVNTESKSIKTIHDKEITFTKKEYDLLLFFIINRRGFLQRKQLQNICGKTVLTYLTTSDFIYTHLNNIRKKLKIAGSKDYIKTLYGMGYKFTDA